MALCVMAKPFKNTESKPPLWRHEEKKNLWCHHVSWVRCNLKYRSVADVHSRGLVMLVYLNIHVVKLMFLTWSPCCFLTTFTSFPVWLYYTFPVWWKHNFLEYSTHWCHWLLFRMYCNHILKKEMPCLKQLHSLCKQIIVFLHGS